MRNQEDSLNVLVVEEDTDGFSALNRRPVSAQGPGVTASANAVIARLHSFDLVNQPLITAVPGLPDEVVAARSTVPLASVPVGSTLVVLFECGDVRRPIIVGVLEAQEASPEAQGSLTQTVSVHADDDRVVLSADREIVLRCGQASITLTKSGKVLIQGAYVSSRSSGVNRIKGGSVQIN
jgi:hypothetical protein